MLSAQIASDSLDGVQNLQNSGNIFYQVGGVYCGEQQG